MAAKKKNNTKQVVKPHTQAKLDIYQQYLKAYLSILTTSKRVHSVEIHDVYCGPGRYNDGKAGSPLLTYSTIENVIKNSVTLSHSNVKMFCNDKNKKKINDLENNLPIEKDRICNISLSNTDGASYLKSLLANPSNPNEFVTRLLFIDPYGYKDINKATLENLMKKKGTEIILFMPVAQLYRFTKHATKLDKMGVEEKKYYQVLINFIHTFFDENHPMRKNEYENIYEYMKFIQEALKFNNKMFSSYHYIQRDKQENYYAVFFMTSHLLGLERFVKAKWDLNPINGEGFKESHMATNQMELFTEHTKNQAKSKKVSDLKYIILNRLAQGPINNYHLFVLALEHGFLAPHVNSIYREIKEEVEIINLKSGQPARALYLDALKLNDFKKNPNLCENLVEIRKK